ncbi:uncharacterized protein LOC129806227 isoform X1 [Phlebotomus papatasi]|uniref:uncharacterized protein LOC129806227 isoform X1 n=1 Tax=Phlebotomus papatasi TaxID=29031 RepID=UPI00248374C2|nr:uncharacterized protein LOC129806227 isoform X1 [Phlebotomus papatasi]
MEGRTEEVFQEEGLQQKAKPVAEIHPILRNSSPVIPSGAEDEDSESSDSSDDSQNPLPKSPSVRDSTEHFFDFLKAQFIERNLPKETLVEFAKISTEFLKKLDQDK